MHIEWKDYFQLLRVATQSPLVAQTIKSLPAVWETGVWSLGQEDLLEKGMAAHSSVPAWRIPWTEETVGFNPQSRKELDMPEHIEWRG